MPSIVSSHSLESNPVRHLLPLLQWKWLPMTSIWSQQSTTSPILFDLAFHPSLAYSAAHSLLPCLLEQHTFQVFFVFNRPSISFLGYSSSCWHCNASRPKESVFIFSFVPSLTVLVITSNFMLVTHKHVSPAPISLQNSRLIKLTAIPKSVLGHLIASNSTFQTRMSDFPLCFAYNLPQLSWW